MVYILRCESRQELIEAQTMLAAVCQFRQSLPKKKEVYEIQILTEDYILLDKAIVQGKNLKKIISETENFILKKVTTGYEVGMKLLSGKIYTMNWQQKTEQELIE